MQFCIIKKNYLYEEVYDLIDIEELNMNNPNHQDKIYYIIKKFLTNNKTDIIFSEKFNDKEMLYEELFVQLTKSDQDDGSQGNTLVIYADQKCMYEMIYLENFNVKEQEQEQSQMNQFATLANTELKPVYGNCAIIKTTFENNQYSLENIDIDDIFNIFINNFYHNGVMVDVKGNMTDVLFAGTEPNNFIGSLFKPHSSIEVFGLQIVPFIEESDKINEVVSKIFGTEIRGRVYLTTLCAPTNTKFWNLCKKDIEYILEISKDKDKVKKINDEFLNNKFTNPFFLLKKYK